MSDARPTQDKPSREEIMRPLRRQLYFVKIVALVLMAGAAFCFYWSWSYNSKYGGGLPDRAADGRPALNDHGEYTIVSEEVYSEARSRETLAYIACLFTVVVMGALLLRFVWLKRRTLSGMKK